MLNQNLTDKFVVLSLNLSRGLFLPCLDRLLSNCMLDVYSHIRLLICTTLKVPCLSVEWEAYSP